MKTVIFHSYVNLPEGNHDHHHDHHQFLVGSVGPGVPGGHFGVAFLVKDGENQRRVLKDWMTEPGSQRFWRGRFEWDFHQAKPWFEREKWIKMARVHHWSQIGSFSNQVENFTPKLEFEQPQWGISSTELANEHTFCGFSCAKLEKNHPRHAETRDVKSPAL